MCSKRTMKAAALLAAGCAIAAACRRPSAGAAEPSKPQAPGATGGIEVVDEAFGQVAPAEAKVSCIAGERKFTEGPVWLADRKWLLFSDISADTIYRWEQGKPLEVYRKPSHNANGNTTDPQGRLITCEHGSRSLTRTAKDGTLETLAATYKGKRLNSPNDAVVRKDGTIWFTDPPYGIRRGQSEQPANYVFRLDPGAKEPAAVAEDFLRPNGLCFSPDEKLLYVADSDRQRHHVRRFRVTPENGLADGKVFATIEPGAPDGMRIDADGRLYVAAGDGVQVFSAAGKLLGRIRTPKAATNCAFGGAKGRTLFITARDAVWAVDLAVTGPK